jgi:SAM-dependent methyltransferase
MSKWNIETDVAEPEIRAFLQANAPWRVAVTFNGRISSEEYGVTPPFNHSPLTKIKAVEPHIPRAALSGTVLDIGFNAGYNSIYLAKTYGARTAGVEVTLRHQTVASFLSRLSQTSCEFLIGDGETFLREGAFDLVLHFGTLYHQPNPILSLKTAALNLKPGGWLALETTAYLAGADPYENLYLCGAFGDPTNTWALSKATIDYVLQDVGFAKPKLIAEVSLEVYQGRMSRVCFIAQKR